MFQLIDQILHQFRSSFKRKATWRWFAVIMLGFMVRNRHRGVSSIISDLRLKPRVYHSVLHFFRSDAYEVVDIDKKWTEIVVTDPFILMVGGRVVNVGDHIKLAKEGRRMPDIRILHQESENSGKGEFIAGHTFAQIGAVMTSGSIARYIPLATQAQQSPPKIPGTDKPDGDTLVVQMVKLGLDVAEYTYEATGRSTIIAVDAYFSKYTAFQAAKTRLTTDGRPLMSIVTRAADNYVGFTPPVSKSSGKRSPGRPRKYGGKVVLKDLFGDMSAFTETTMTLYGKKSKVKYLCVDLLWKPLGEIVRFVLLDSEWGKCVLMTDDLTISPEDIVAVYSLRFKIETSFNEQKNDIGCFAYHFWTMSLAKRQRRKASLPPTDETAQEKITKTKKAVSSFVCMGAIATGILTIIAFKHDCEIWKRYPGWVRTLRTRIPSVSVVRETISADFHALLRHFPSLAISKTVLPLLRCEDYWYARFNHDVFDETA